MTTRIVTVLALAFTLVGTACTDEFSPTEPLSTTAAFAPNRNRNATLGSSSGPTGARVGAVQAVIGSGGGRVALPNKSGTGYHVLDVPPHTVELPTIFVMENAESVETAVDLSATELDTGTPVTRFEIPLKLSLSYVEMEVRQPRRLTIVYVVDGEIHEVIESTVDTRSKIVTGKISHFSRYAVAFQ